MRENNFEIRVVGVTAARSDETPGSLLKKSIKKGHVKTEIYAYTITRGSPLAKLLDQLGINEIGLAFSTFGLAYFTPSNFRQCLVDVGERLIVNGGFYGISYNYVPAGLKVSSDGFFYFDPLIKPEHPLSKVFGLFFDEKEYKKFRYLPPIEKRDSYIKTIDFCIKRGLISERKAIELVSGVPFANNFDEEYVYQYGLNVEQKKELMNILIILLLLPIRLYLIIGRQLKL